MNAGPKIILKCFYVKHYISLTLLYNGNDKIATQTQMFNVSKNILNFRNASVHFSLEGTLTLTISGRDSKKPLFVAWTRPPPSDKGSFKGSIILSSQRPCFVFPCCYLDVDRKLHGLNHDQTHECWSKNHSEVFFFYEIHYILFNFIVLWE